MPNPKTIIVVGGGIIGTMHAVLAVENGFKVTQIEKDRNPVSASVRNFGLIWVSGRLAGKELDLALRARELWEKIGTKTSIGFRSNGSLTVAQNEAEFSVMAEAMNMKDSDLRGFRLLTQEETQKIEHSFAGNFVGSLQCVLDAAVEPNLLLGGLREYLQLSPLYNWLPETEIVDFNHNETGNHLRDRNNNLYSADYIAICTGAIHDGLISEFMSNAAVRKVHLQMAATLPIDVKINHSFADADSLRYYPAFKNLNLHNLGPQSEIAAKYKMQLLAVQRNNGELTIGDTHEYDEPFSHEIFEEPYRHLTKAISNILGIQPPELERRWSGIYSQSTSEDIYFRREITPGVVIVTGGGGRGNTLAPAIAEETLNSWTN